MLRLSELCACTLCKQIGGAVTADDIAIRNEGKLDNLSADDRHFAADARNDRSIEILVHAVYEQVDMGLFIHDPD